MVVAWAILNVNLCYFAIFAVLFITQQYLVECLYCIEYSGIVTAFYSQSVMRDVYLVRFSLCFLAFFDFYAILAFLAYRNVCTRFYYLLQFFDNERIIGIAIGDYVRLVYVETLAALYGFNVLRNGQ